MVYLILVMLFILKLKVKYYLFHFEFKSVVSIRKSIIDQIMYFMVNGIRVTFWIYCKYDHTIL